MVNAKKTLILLLVLVVVVSLSGCDEAYGEEQQYDDNVITIEYYSVSSLKPYAERPTTIRFFLRNNGQYDVENLVVDFFNIQDFSVTDMYCDDADNALSTGMIQIIEGNQNCTYNTFEDYEKKVWIMLMAPDNDKIPKPTTLRVDYNVSYDYFGVREAHIPIVDEMTIIKPMSKFTQTAHSPSPIHVSFEPPVGDVRIEDGVEIKEYWGTQNEPFELNMNFKHVGSSSVGTIGKLEIEEGNVKLRSSGLSIFSGLPCDFTVSGDEMVSNKEVEIPGTLTCYFVLSNENPLPEVTETLQAEFTFSYNFVRSQEFEVQPLSD